MRITLMILPILCILCGAGVLLNIVQLQRTSSDKPAEPAAVSSAHQH